MRTLVLISMIMGVAAMGCCADPNIHEPVRLIFDTDIGNDIDDALALALIHSLADRGEVSLLAVTVNKDNPWAAVYVDVVNHFYRRPNVPIGTVRDGKTPEDGYVGTVAQRKVDGEFVYQRRLKSGADAPEAVSLLRRTLASQADGSVVIVSVGFMTNLARLLDSAPDSYSSLGGAELVKKKVRLYVMMAGAFSKSPEPEYNVIIDADAARKVYERWPTPVVATGFEIGKEILYPAESIEKDFGYVKNHPIADAYRAFQKMPYDRPAWDLTAVLYAIRPDRGYFGISSPGRITLDDKNVTRFAADEKGSHRYLTVTQAQIDRVGEAFTWLVSAPPKARAGATPQNHKVICSDAGAGGYQAFPDVVRLANGDLICVFYAGYGHVSVPTEKLPRGARIMIMRSTDNGETWSKPETAVDTPIDDRDPHIMQLSDGTILLSFFTRVAPSGKGVERFEETRDVYLVRSNDNGKTWDKMPQLIAKDHAASAPIRQLSDGTLLLGVYTQDSTKIDRFYKSGIVRSTDNGKNWSEPILIPNSCGHSHDETDVTQLPSGKVLAFMRPCMCSSTSDDGGLTWSDAKPVGFEGHAPCFLRTSEGVLLVGHRLPNTSLHYSLDDAATWKGPVELDKCRGAYPGFCELPDGRILCVYYEEGENSAIRQIIFRITDNGVVFE